MVSGFGFGGFRAEVLGFRAWGLASGSWVFGLRLQGLGPWA